MVLSYHTLTLSVQAIGAGEEETKFEKWLQRVFGKSIYDVIMVIVTVLGVVLAFGLFFYLPIFLTKWFDTLSGGSLGWFKNLMEGSMRIGLIRKKNVVFSRYANSYVKALKKHLSLD